MHYDYDQKYHQRISNVFLEFVVELCQFFWLLQSLMGMVLDIIIPIYDSVALALLRNHRWNGPFCGVSFDCSSSSKNFCNKNKGVTVQPFNIMYYVRSVKRLNGFLSFEDLEKPT